MLTSNKHAYARMRGAVLEVRVPKHLTPLEREKVVAVLLKKHARVPRQESLFQQMRAQGIVTFAWGETLAIPQAMQKCTETTFRRWLLSQARTRAHEQVLADLRAFTVLAEPKRPLRHVLIRDLTARWGSCSHGGDIIISLATLLLPYTLYAYVCAHEVAHLTHMDHSPRFWHHLQGLVPQSRERRAELRSYHLSS